MFTAPLRARDYVTNLLARGRPHFTTEEAVEALGVSRSAALAALERLARKAEVTSPCHGFWLIIEPPYRRIGSPPAEDYVTELMAFLNQPFYVGLLSAAALYGAAHQKPQAFQVITDAPRRGLDVGRVAFRFIARKNMADVPVRELKSRVGFISVSTPEATAFDLVGYFRHAGGLDNVATVLMELSEKLHGEELARIAPFSLLPWAQRLGFLLETLELDESVDTGPLRRFVEESDPRVTPLDPRVPIVGAKRDRRWRVAMNTKLDPDL